MAHPSLWLLSTPFAPCMPAATFFAAAHRPRAGYPPRYGRTLFAGRRRGGNKTGQYPRLGTAPRRKQNRPMRPPARTLPRRKQNRPMRPPARTLPRRKQNRPIRPPALSLPATRVHRLRPRAPAKQVRPLLVRTPPVLGGAGRLSDCQPYRVVIEAKLEQGLTAQRIYQDLAGEHGFTGSYYSVRRFVHRLEEGTPLPFRRMECGPGEEGAGRFRPGRRNTRRGGQAQPAARLADGAELLAQGL